MVIIQNALTRSSTLLCRKIEKHNVLRITAKTISRVAEVIGGAKSAGTRIDGLDKLRGDPREREHN